MLLKVSSMKVKNVNDYVIELAKIFPEVEESSIRSILKLGNSSILKTLRSVTGAVRFKSKSMIDSTTNVFTMYRAISPARSNKEKNIKRRKDGVK